MTKYFPFFIPFIFFLTVGSVPAQNSALDSLKNALTQAEEDEGKLEILHQLIGAHFSLDPGKAIDYAHTFDSIAAQLDLLEWKAKAKNNLGLSYYSAAQYNQAIEYLLQSLPLWESLEDTLYLGKVYLNIGACYQKRENQDQTIRYYKKGLQYFEAVNDSTWIANTYNNIASQYTRKNELDSAAYFYNQALQIYESANYTRGMRSLYTNLGVLYAEKEDFSTALAFHRKALAATDSIQSPERYIRVLNNIANTLMLMKNFGEAKPVLDLALRMTGESGSLERKRQTLGNLSEWHERTGRYKEALAYWRQYAQVKDSIFNQEKDATMVEMLTKYETEKKEAENEYLLSQNQIKDLQLKSAKRQRTFFLLGLLALATILGVIFYAYQTKQKSNRELAEKNDIISKALAEKEVLLKEIHHRVKNNLQVISSLLSLQSRRVEDEATATAILESRNRVRAMALIHQHLYREDNPTGVDASTYISKLVENLFDTYNVNADKIKFEKNIQPLSVDIDTIIPFGLIINELISNALKYAFPKGTSGKVRVELKEEAGKLALEVEDNGVGLPEGFNLQKLNSFGYKLIHVFSKKMQAVLDVQSQQGTRVRLVAPI